MAGSWKQHIGIGGVDPNTNIRNEVHILATDSHATTSLSYSLHDGRDEKKLHTEPPPASVGCEPEIRPQSKKRNQVFTLSLVLASLLTI